MKIGSLCSGYGGLDLATAAVFGGEVAWHCENDADAGRILAHHWPGVLNHGDLTAVDWTVVEAVDLLTAGYPCQPFSVAGKRKGEDDERHLWPDVARAIRDLRPGLVVLENVPGHLVRGFPAVVGELASIGYDARWTCVRASDVGAPHRRNRLFVIAADATRDSGADQSRRDREIQFVAVDRAGTGDAGGSGTAGTGRPRRCAGLVAAAPANADGTGRIRSGEPGYGVGSEAGPAAGRDGAPVLPDTDGASRRPVEPRRIDWGSYAPAIRRWERVLRRAAPVPTEHGPRGGRRLSPAFVEWMMGLPASWVTDPAIGISRNAQLRTLGNGVVVQQAIAAELMLLRGEAVAA